MDTRECTKKVAFLHSFFRANMRTYFSQNKSYFNVKNFFGYLKRNNFLPAEVLCAIPCAFLPACTPLNTYKGRLVLYYILFAVKFIYSEKATKILRNLLLTFDHSTYSQKLVEDFAKFCGLLRIFELYMLLYPSSSSTSQNQFRKARNRC